MSGKRTTMRKLRDVLRLRFQAGLSLRDISRSTKLSVGEVQKLIRRAQALKLSWPLRTAMATTHCASAGARPASTRCSAAFVCMAFAIPPPARPSCPARIFHWSANYSATEGPTRRWDTPTLPMRTSSKQLRRLVATSLR